VKIFLDNADIEQISHFRSLGIIDGVTTNPTMLRSIGSKDLDRHLCEIANLVDELHVEALGDTVEQIVSAARGNYGLGGSIVSKIPIGEDGLAAVQILRNEGIATNLHLVFSVNQAILAAKAGAEYICPLIGRLNDSGAEGFEILGEIVTVLRAEEDFTTMVMASSIRSPEDVRRASLVGVDAITIPSEVLSKCLIHPLTTQGVEIFKRDSKRR